MKSFTQYLEGKGWQFEQIAPNMVAAQSSTTTKPTTPTSPVGSTPPTAMGQKTTNVTPSPNVEKAFDNLLIQNKLPGKAKLLDVYKDKQVKGLLAKDPTAVPYFSSLYR